MLQFVLYMFMFLAFYLIPSSFSLNFVDGNQISSINDNGGLHDSSNPYDTFNYFNNKNSDRTGLGGSADNGAGGGQPPNGHRGDNGGRYGNGGAISMSGGTIKNINPKYNNMHSSSSNVNLNAKSNTFKEVAICEKGQCNLRPNA